MSGAKLVIGNQQESPLAESEVEACCGVEAKDETPPTLLPTSLSAEPPIPTSILASAALPAHPFQLWRRPHGRTLITLSLATLLSGALVVILLLRVVAASQGLTTIPISPLIGHPAPDFTIQTWTWNGAPSQRVHLAALRGHPVVVNFWASWCDACRAEESALEAAYQRYQAQGIVFIGVAFDDTQQNGVPFLQQYQVTFPSGPDVTGAISISYGLTGVPETVFIDRNGVVRQKWIGGITDGARNINTEIAALLASSSSPSSQPVGARTCSDSALRCIASVSRVLYTVVRNEVYECTRISVDARHTARLLVRRALP